ncbi:MAG: tetratricopeptide repeat protein [Sandaracinus sp.]
MRRALLTLVVLLGLAPRSVAHAMPPGQDGARLTQAAIGLDRLHVAEASAELDALAAAYPDDPDVRFERGYARLLRGEYAAARDDLEGSLVRAVGLRGAAERAMLARVAHETEAVTHGFEELRSADGRFVIRYAPGPDRFVAHDALAVLARVDEGLGAELGAHHQGPIRLEILPTATALSRVSSLSIEDIERTGTIALCKWDRLMITSPRALVHGYPWADTIGHETVHLLLAQISEDEAPVWMQEGYARFLERRWRGAPPAVRLDEGTQRLLVTRAAQGTLIPFEDLHPSIAMLPSAEDAALAFAQVSTFVQTFYGMRGSAGLVDVASRVRRGEDARQAFAESSGGSWDALEGQWRDAVGRMPLPGDDAPEVPRLELRHGEGEPDDSGEVTEERARRAVRLGDLLWTAQRYLAAAAEYGRAHEIAPEDPVVASRLARAAVRGGDGAAAIAALEPLRARFPEHAPLLANLGAAYALVGDRERARETSRAATEVNPFDPEPHCTLALVEDAESDDVVFQREACAALGGSVE